MGAMVGGRSKRRQGRGVWEGTDEGCGGCGWRRGWVSEGVLVGSPTGGGAFLGAGWPIGSGGGAGTRALIGGGGAICAPTGGGGVTGTAATTRWTRHVITGSAGDGGMSNATSSDTSEVSTRALDGPTPHLYHDDVAFDMTTTTGGADGNVACRFARSHLSALRFPL